jgi:GntR family transcriptional regulator/MocR family aminotransferase
MWDVQLALEADAETPMFLQLSQEIMEKIQRGLLKPGARLPGSRTLAKQLKVHRNTVLAAYGELESQGWLESQEARGTFVSRELSSIPAFLANEGASGIAEEVGFPFYNHHRPRTLPIFPRGTLALQGGYPDLRELPVQAFVRATRRVLQQQTNVLLNYGDPAGWPALRRAISEMLAARRGLEVKPEQMLLTRGSQMGISLAAQALLRPGDVVAVEHFGYEPAWTALRMAGAHLEPLPVDEDGLDVDALEALLQRRPVRAVYLTPHHQFPTLAVLSASRRMQLLSLAQRYRFAILEDDYDHEFHFEGKPILPLASADRAGVVVYIGTLSKVLAPGLRLGYVVAPAGFVEALVGLRMSIDRQGDQAGEAALAELFEEGEIQRHVRRMRRLYQERREILIHTLERELSDILTIAPSRGGMALWAKVAPSLEVRQWQERCLQKGVWFATGDEYDFGRRPQPYARLGFARLREGELKEAVRRMKAAL